MATKHYYNRNPITTPDMRMVNLPIFNAEVKKWLFGIFKQTENSPLILNRNQNIGAYIGSWIRYGNTPKKHKHPSQIQVVAPMRIARSADKHFLFFAKEDIQKINDHLHHLYIFDFDSFNLAGQKLGYKQKQIIEAFIISRNLLTFFNSDNETIKKRNYRQNIQLLKKQTEKIRLQAYRRAQKIEQELIREINQLIIN